MKQETSVLRRLAESAETGELPENASFVYRISGGAPGERYEEAVVLTASGDVRVTLKDELRGKPAVSVRDEVGPEEPLEICRLLVSGSEHLTPAAEARFLPDTLVGSVSVGIGDEAETYYFEAEEAGDDRAEAVEQVGPAPDSGLEAIRERFHTIERRLLAKGPGLQEE